MSIGTTWQTYLSLFLASLLQLPHSAAGHPFTLCGKNELGVSSVEFVPDPPRHGQNLEVTISGVSNVDVNGGTARMTVKLFGQTIDEELYDICRCQKFPLHPRCRIIFHLCIEATSESHVPTKLDTLTKRLSINQFPEHCGLG